jgi:thiamine-phosphate pyrophosphorylase
VFLHGKSSRAPILCYVTDRRALPCALEDQIESLLRRIASAAAAGIDWIQIREKDLSGKELSFLTREALAQTKQIDERGQRARILVNDRLDVALSERANGVHLGENSLPVQDVRKWLDEKPELAKRQEFRVGVSCHSLKGALAAARDGADYIFFGPVFATPSKTAFGAPQGLQRLREVCSAVAVPVLAIGGITVDNASDCLAAGAAGIAAIRLFQETSDPASLIARFRSILCGVPNSPSE